MAADVVALALAPGSAPGLAPLIEDPPAPTLARGGWLPEPLRSRYGGDLAIGLDRGRPTVIANFVSTLDGVVSYRTPEAAGGGEISGFFEPDRFVMGLLRALADVVLIGAGTLRAAPTESWTPGFIHPPSAGDFAALRRELGLRPNPATVVVTGSGRVDLAHPGLADPATDVLVLTSDRGASALSSGGVPTHAEIVSIESDRLTAPSLIDELARRGARLVLCEGGPHLLGQLLEGRLVDELFLTLAPQLAGRSPDTPRLGLVEGTAFDLTGAPWGSLVGLRRSGDHLFARYSFRKQERMG